MKLLNEKQIFDKWSPKLSTQFQGLNENKLRWMSRYCHYHTLNEAASQTLTNLPGMGAIFAPQTMGSQNAFHTGTNGSGDKYPSLLPLAVQVASRTVGFDIVDVIPMPGPSFQLSYLDYVYAGGKLDTTEAPLLIKFNIAGTFTVGTTYSALGGASTVTLIFVGYSRIDGEAIFRVDAIATPGATIANSIVPTTTTILDSDPVLPVAQPVLGLASLVKTMEDHIQGFVGAGYNNTDDFQNNTRNGVTLSSGMSRKVGEETPYNSTALQTYTKFVEAKTIQVATGVTQEQIADLGKQYGIDVVSMVENSLMNELTQHINKEILDRCFALGWENHNRWANAENAGGSFNLNIGAALPATVSYTGMTGNLLGLSIGADVLVPGNFENSQTLQRKVFTRCLAIGAVITQRGRRGPATFMVTNAQIGALLQDNKHFQAAPMQNTLSQQNGALYPVGSISGMMVYVDPYMAWSDNRVLVGRKGGNDEPGVKFMPYLMAESVHTIAEGTMSPKIAVKTRYALVDAGHHPETMYFTFYISMAQQLV